MRDLADFEGPSTAIGSLAPGAPGPSGLPPRRRGNERHLGGDRLGDRYRVRYVVNKSHTRHFIYVYDPPGVYEHHHPKFPARCARRKFEVHPPKMRAEPENLKSTPDSVRVKIIFVEHLYRYLGKARSSVLASSTTDGPRDQLPSALCQPYFHA